MWSEFRDQGLLSPPHTFRAVHHHHHTSAQTLGTDPVIAVSRDKNEKKASFLFQSNPDSSDFQKQTIILSVSL